MHPFIPFLKPAFPAGTMASNRPESSPEPSIRAPQFKRDLVFVINPGGANGTAMQRWKMVLPYLRSRLDKNSKIHESVTSYPDQAIGITMQAIRDGVDAVIAVGGDGMLNQVLNGFFWEGELLSNHNKQTSTALGLIPMGTGSDFARTMGWSNDPFEAADRIVRGVSSKIDVGVVTGKDETQRYFLNVADTHLSAKAGFYAGRYKQFGAFCYVISGLQAFWGHKNVDFKIKVDDGEWEELPLVTALCVGNAKFYGGGMKIAPNGDPSSGNLEVVILRDFKWYDFILNLHRLYGGTHLSMKNVQSRRVLSIEVEPLSGDGDVYVQADGEHLGFLPRKFHILPGAIDFIGRHL